MEEKKNILTYEGLKKYEEELEHLKVVTRKEVAQKIKEAREQGDLSENAEYDAAKEWQGKLETKIALLKKTIMEAKIIDTSHLDNSTVQILCSVQIKNLKNGATMKYRIVSETEANLREGKIAVNTPIAKGLLGKKVGEIAEVRVPAGLLQFEILNITFEE